ncbi:MAG: hypothetical protein ACKO3W_10270 [bacterium]
MSPRTTRLIAPLLAALVAVLGVMSPALGMTDANLRKRATAGGAGETSCCGDDCRCGANCPCVERDTSPEPTSLPLAPVESRGVRALCLAAPASTATTGLVVPASRGSGLATANEAPSVRPAGRELLARVSKWTT